MTFSVSDGPPCRNNGRFAFSPEVSSLGPSASALGLFLAPGCRCRRKALVATRHNASSEKKQRGDEFAALPVP
jgi:hypothetical protein